MTTFLPWFVVVGIIAVPVATLLYGIIALYEDWRNQ